MSAPIQVAVTLDSATRKKDRSVTLKFTTNAEVTSPDYMQMDSRVLAEGWLLFSANELQEADVPIDQAESRNGKSKGHRLRAVYFLIWKKRQIDEPFDPWFDRQFERYMDRLKD